MSVELDLLNTCSICRHEPNGDLPSRPAIERAGPRLASVETRVTRSPTIRPIARVDSRRIDGRHSTGREGTMVPQ
jgi:hypothetical protein